MAGISKTHTPGTVTIDCILPYFPTLTERQKEQFLQLGELYLEWNDKINLISRKDTAQLYEHHILHALGIAKILQFRPGAEVLDLGTGGGLPGLPLAILFPETRFTLIDGTGKKIQAVQDMAARLGLENVRAKHMRAEELKQQFDFVVTRGVATLDKLLLWTKKLFSKKQQHALPNGLLALKGGNLKGEIETIRKGNFVQSFPLSEYFKETYFVEKFVVYVQG